MNFVVLSSSPSAAQTFHTSLSNSIPAGPVGVDATARREEVRHRGSKASPEELSRGHGCGVGGQPGGGASPLLSVHVSGSKRQPRDILDTLSSISPIYKIICSGYTKHNGLGSAYQSDTSPFDEALQCVGDVLSGTPMLSVGSV